MWSRHSGISQWFRACYTKELQHGLLLFHSLPCVVKKPGINRNAIKTLNPGVSNNVTVLKLVFVLSGVFTNILWALSLFSFKSHESSPCDCHTNPPLLPPQPSEPAWTYLVLHCGHYAFPAEPARRDSQSLPTRPAAWPRRHRPKSR